MELIPCPIQTSPSPTTPDRPQAQQDLHSTRRRADGLEERNKKLRSENLALRVRVRAVDRAGRWGERVGGGKGCRRRRRSRGSRSVLAVPMPCLMTASPPPPRQHTCAQEKIGLLERYDFEHVQQSVCMRQYTRCRVAETY